MAKLKKSHSQITKLLKLERIFFNIQVADEKSGLSAVLTYLMFNFLDPLEKDPQMANLITQTILNEHTDSKLP